ncbi:MAG TPA: ABC transporter permease [Ktedonobacteraceae bacterium]|jgi:simple sugar transport system permease protein|nr:ABC transporter permease [Ktedonobacteraceae bacterium]
MAKKILATTAKGTESPPVSRKGRFWSTLAGIFLKQREASIAVIVVVLIIYFQISNQAFLSSANVRTLSQFVAATAIISAGEVMLLICGEIDLSLGMVFALAPFIMYFAHQAGLPLLVGVILSLLVSMVVGFFNGVVTVLFKVPSLIGTLGTLFLLNGFTLTISQGFPVLTPPNGTFNEVMGHSGYSEILWAIGIVIVMQIVLSWTRWGLHTIATGGNPLGASEVGVNVNWVKIGNFMLAGVFAGFAGILEAFRITSIDPLAGGTDIMFAAVAGAVIGGTALTGGLGTIIGALLGTLVLSILKDGFTLLGVSAYTFDLILGVAILIAMILNVRLQIWRKIGRQ